MPLAKDPCHAPRRASDISRRSAKWQSRRQAIIDTSAHLFARRGYHATGIMELCEANDLGKGALYHYIGSKEELLAAIHDRVMDEVMLGRRTGGRGRGVPLAPAGQARGRAARGHPPLPGPRLGVPARVPGPHRRARREFRERRRGYERQVEAVLRAGIDSGDFRDLDPG